MKIAYSWLKEYVDTTLAPDEISEILTQTGLEVGGIEKFQSIKGGLEGLVIGEVVSCEPHPNSDHLNLTKVDVKGEELLPIVCGASNVAQGQKVVVATVGAVLYHGSESFTIKKAKLRGELSMGMICSEVEIGVGQDASGIMVLPNEVAAGTKAKDYFQIEDDYTIEIDLTPNRIDGASHIGVARDLVAYLKQKEETTYTKPDVSTFKVTDTSSSISINVEDAELCPRYAGVCMKNIQIQDSPQWLQNRLKSVGLTPINNIVDITNYVLFETGQPLHAFDKAKVGNQIQVKTVAENTKFTTLDEKERELSAHDLMICNEQAPMCIAGVFGGIDSGVTATTTEIFLESAYFNPVSVRKTARRHALNTDASFRFERGVDPEMTLYALKRAALLIEEIAGGTVSSEIVDFYPNPLKGADVTLSLDKVNRLIGIDFTKEQVCKILQALEIEIQNETADTLQLYVPAYRVDVTREADVIEEILRIYGYNNIPVKRKVSSVLSYAPKPDSYELKNKVADYLVSIGCNEIMNNSLTKSAYYQDSTEYPEASMVAIENPLSQDLGVMRKTLLFGGLESIAYNSNRKRSDLKFFEFGATYHHKDKQQENPVEHYSERDCLGLFLTGNEMTESWSKKVEPIGFFHLKSCVENVLTHVGLKGIKRSQSSYSSELLSEGLVYAVRSSELVRFGLVKEEVLKKFSIKNPVYFAEFDWENILKEVAKSQISFTPLVKFPSVRRDFALLVDAHITFSEIEEVARKTEQKLLTEINLFDVYEGSKLPSGKKSYAISVFLQDKEKTLTEKQIEKISQKLQANFEKQLGATLR